MAGLRQAHWKEHYKMSSLTSPPTVKQTNKQTHKQSNKTNVHSFAHLFNNTTDESALSNLWIFKNNDCFPPKQALQHNEIDTGIEYHRTNDAHCFLITPNHFTSPLIFLYCIDDTTVQNQTLTKSNPETSTHPTSQLKTIITVAEGAPLTLIECYAHQNNFLAQSIAQTEIILQNKAQVQHLILQKGFGESSQTLESRVTQRSHSIYTGAAFSFDLLSYQTTIDFHLEGAFAKTTFHALMAVKEKQKARLSLTTHHLHSDCESTMMVRGLANDGAQGEFLGKIIVNKNATNSQAHLENKNLLLSEQSEIITRPLLEVYNDDVQCSHGATVGQLDAEALFYLRSRGISEDIAKKMLVDAFIHPILEGVSPVILPYIEECIRGY